MAGPISAKDGCSQQARKRLQSQLSGQCPNAPLRSSWGGRWQVVKLVTASDSCDWRMILKVWSWNPPSDSIDVSFFPLRMEFCCNTQLNLGTLRSEMACWFHVEVPMAVLGTWHYLALTFPMSSVFCATVTWYPCGSCADWSDCTGQTGKARSWSQTSEG